MAQLGDRTATDGHQFKARTIQEALNDLEAGLAAGTDPGAGLAHRAAVPGGLHGGRSGPLPAAGWVTTQGPHRPHLWGCHVIQRERPEKLPDVSRARIHRRVGRSEPLMGRRGGSQGSGLPLIEPGWPAR